jgi:hypothetical protein
MHTLLIEGETLWRLIDELIFLDLRGIQHIVEGALLLEGVDVVGDWRMVLHTTSCAYLLLWILLLRINLSIRKFFKGLIMITASSV